MLIIGIGIIDAKTPPATAPAAASWTSFVCNALQPIDLALLPCRRQRPELCEQRFCVFKLYINIAAEVADQHPKSTERLTGNAGRHPERCQGRLGTNEAASPAAAATCVTIANDFPALSEIESPALAANLFLTNEPLINSIFSKILMQGFDFKGVRFRKSE